MNDMLFIPPQEYPDEYLKPMPPEFSKLIDENLWDLIGDNEDEEINNDELNHK